jgi:hypothetical protein
MADDLRDAENATIKMLGTDKALRSIMARLAQLEQEVAKLKSQMGKKEK